MIYIGFEEEWRPIVVKGKYKTNYSVSNFGKVRNDKTGKILKPSQKGKYPIVTIRYKNNKGKTKSFGTAVSRFVAIAFIPIPQRYLDMGLAYRDLDVDHIRDGDSTNHEDNSVYNLQWLTHEENIEKAKDKGLYEKENLKGTKQPDWDWMVGGSNPNAKYNESLVRKICRDIENNKMSMKDIAKKYDVKYGFVTDLKSGKAWAHITKEYDFTKYDKRKNQFDTHTDKDRELLDELIRRGATNAQIYSILKLDPEKHAGWIYRHRIKLGCPPPVNAKSKNKVSLYDKVKEGKSLTTIETT